MVEDLSLPEYLLLIKIQEEGFSDGTYPQSYMTHEEMCTSGLLLNKGYVRWRYINHRIHYLLTEKGKKALNELK